MKVIHLVISLFMVLSSLGYTQDFRNSNWGDTKDQVIAAETFSEYGQEGDGIVFMGEVSNLAVAAVYNFLPDNRLYMGGYIFNENYTNENQHIADYEKINDVLKRVYGEPSTEDITWSDDLYQDDPSRYGFAVSLGHLTYSTEWITESTGVSHQLKGNNYDLTHAVRYDSSTLSDDATREQEDTEDDAF